MTNPGHRSMGQNPTKPTEPDLTEADELMKVFYPDWTGQLPPCGLSSSSRKLPIVKNPHHYTTFEHFHDMFNLIVDAGWWLSLVTMRVLSIRLLLFHVSLALVAWSEKHGLENSWLCPSCIEVTLSRISILTAAIFAISAICFTLGPVIRQGTPLRVMNILNAGHLVPWFGFVFLCVWLLGKWKESLEIEHGSYSYSGTSAPFNLN